ncbi:hypothetical protein L210DRAFT_3630642 [Boletus edulis BED1]|uniref:Uncharacterized protein n=1 Tax=Boletus edulis BED1 TaxID=1328754 RepID=A0AAD4BUG5_BOLED|nr:hypothetical protein L210DRAFT_3630642 [Boletus edulis BED1]
MSSLDIALYARPTRGGGREGADGREREWMGKSAERSSAWDGSPTCRVGRVADDACSEAGAEAGTRLNVRRQIHISLKFQPETVSGRGEGRRLGIGARQPCKRDSTWTGRQMRVSLNLRQCQGGEGYGRRLGMGAQLPCAQHPQPESVRKEGERVHDWESWKNVCAETGEDEQCGEDE